MTHPVRIGVGGWTYAPWRDNFYPAGLAQKRELAFAASKLTAIEINGTFYRSQTPQTFAKWAAETPAGFKFSVKAHRFTTSRKTAEEFGEAIDWFLAGPVGLGEKLGPINWQFPPHRRFDAAYFDAFCGRLPKERAGLELRHAIEVRHESFLAPAFEACLRRHGCALVFADDPDWATPDWATADFAYARLQQSREEHATGYSLEEIDAWARTFRDWAQTRSVFAFVISGAKARDPHAAEALIARVPPCGEGAGRA